jgi:type III restriction enzyme
MRWLDECLHCEGGMFPQLLLFVRFAHQASNRIYRSIVASTEGAPTLKPILRAYEPVGSTPYVDFQTIRATYKTWADKCHVSHIALDSDWESELAHDFENMAEVIAHVKIQGLGFVIPYTFNGVERQYFADFVVRIDDGRGTDDPLNLILEVTGELKMDKEAKTATIVDPKRWTTRATWIC